MSVDVERQALRKGLKSAAAEQQPAPMPDQARRLLAFGKPADVMFCASVFADAGDALVGQLGLKRLRTHIVRSVTVEPILPALTVEAVLAGYVLDIQTGGYGSYAEEMLNPQSSLAAFSPDMVLVILDLEDVAGQLPDLCASGRLDGVEEAIYESASRIAQMMQSLRTHCSARLVLQGLVLPDRAALGDPGEANLRGGLVRAVQQLNSKLAELCASIPDCVFFDVDQVAARFGRAHWQDRRLFLASRLAVSSGAFSIYARALVRSFSTLFRAPRKVLCTDLDNTLWGGVLGEDGPEGIATGSSFPGVCYLEYQKYLKRLAARGVLLAAVSKNNPVDVEEAFTTRSADLALKLTDFVATKIGWNEKADALCELAKELSLGLDSFVFVDDNLAECEAIRQHLPEVAVVAVPVDEPWRLAELLMEQTFFDATVVTEDDMNRSGEYRAQAQRQALSEGATSREEFLSSLEIVCTFVSALDAPLARSVQLLAKTNQFNLTTRRHSASEIEQIAASPGGQAIAIRVRDRFGDAGVVGLALARTDGAVCSIDSLLLSCRVIGRGIETALLAAVAGKVARQGARWLLGEFIPTRKNAPCASFYPDHGFTRNPSREGFAHGAEVYEFDLAAGLPESPGWLTLEGNEIDELATSTLLAS